LPFHSEFTDSGLLSQDINIKTYKIILPVVLYGSLILREGHRLEVLKDMLLCALECERRETEGSYKNLQQEEADWAFR
jgi:hypothetical protein